MQNTTQYPIFKPESEIETIQQVNVVIIDDMPQKSPSAFSVCVGGISKRFPSTSQGLTDAKAFARPFGGHVLTHW